MNAFQRWALRRQIRYERRRRLWRRDHPLIDVKALEDKHGIKREDLSLDELKGKGFVIKQGEP